MKKMTPILGVLLTGVVARIRWEGGDAYYGKDFLLAIASVYPGYGGTPSWGDTLVGGLYGFLAGAICGALIAWLYNRLTLGGGRAGRSR